MPNKDSTKIIGNDFSRDNHNSKNFDSIDVFFSDKERGLLDDPQTRSEPKSLYSHLYAFILMIASVGLRSLSVLLVKICFVNNTYMNGFDYLLVRSVMMVLVAIGQVYYMKISVFNIHPDGRKPLLLRCLFGVVSSPAFFIGLKFLPLSKATLIKNSSPLLVVIAAY